MIQKVSDFQRLRSDAVLSVLFLVAGYGCAGNAPPVDPDVWEERIPQLTATAESRSDDPDAWLRLGIAHDLVEEPEEAIRAFERAVALDPHNRIATLSLLRLRAETGDADGAEAVLRRIDPQALTVESDQELVASARRQIAHTRLKSRMAALARVEAERSESLPQNDTVGVLDFDGEGVAAYDGMGKALTAILTTELTKLAELRVLERQNLQVLLDEVGLAESQKASKPKRPKLESAVTTRGVQQRLSLLRSHPEADPFYSGTIDGVPGPATTEAIRSFQLSNGLEADGISGPRTRAVMEDAIDSIFDDPNQSAENVPSLRTGPKAGRILGARRLLGGEVSVSNENVRVDGRVVDTLDGALLSERVVSSPLGDFHRLPGELIVESAAGLGVTLDEETRRRLRNQEPVTRSLAAFLAFGRGLEHEDHGRWRAASAEYENALELDPLFGLAQERVEITRLGSASFEQSLQRSIRAASSVGRRSRAAAQALGEVGSGTAENDMRDDTDESGRAVQTDGRVLGTLRVSGQIPVR